MSDETEAQTEEAETETAPEPEVEAKAAPKPAKARKGMMNARVTVPNLTVPVDDRNTGVRRIGEGTIFAAPADFVKDMIVKGRAEKA